MTRTRRLVLPALFVASCSANVSAPRTAGQAGTGGSSSPAGTAARGGTGGSPATLGIGGFNVSDAGPRPETGPTEDANCGLQNFALDRRPAIVVLLQDRSTPMRNTLSGGATRCANVVAAL